MITNFLLDNAALLPVAMALLAVVCVGVGFLFRRQRRALGIFAAVSLLPLVALTLVPTTGRAFEFCAVQFSVPTFGAVEPWANVALFVPLVFFATLATDRPLVVLAAGILLSAAIELAQALVPGLGRACDTNDWAMNTAGAVIGVLLASVTGVLTKRA